MLERQQFIELLLLHPELEETVYEILTQGNTESKEGAAQ